MNEDASAHSQLYKTGSTWLLDHWSLTCCGATWLEKRHFWLFLTHYPLRQQILISWTNGIWNFQWQYLRPSPELFSLCGIFLSSFKTETRHAHTHTHVCLYHLLGLLHELTFISSLLTLTLNLCKIQWYRGVSQHLVPTTRCLIFDECANRFHSCNLQITGAQCDCNCKKWLHKFCIFLCL